MISLYQAAVIIIALATLAYMYANVQQLRYCKLAMDAIGHLEVCQACDMLEDMDVIQ